MNEQDLRDCFAMFSMVGLLGSGKITPHDFKYDEIAEGAWKLADAMLKARTPKEETGIVAIKRTRKKNDE